MKHQWKFLRYDGKKITSNQDGSTWKIGEWREVPAPSEVCRGLNSCQFITDALRYVQGEILAKVECAGVSIHADNKSTWQKQRIVRAWIWDKRASVRLAVFSARECLPAYESKYPNDARVRKAIEAAEAWLEAVSSGAADSEANAAYSEANAAYSAANEAYRGAVSAYSAAYAAYSAANAAYSAASAAYAAYSAAYSEACSEACSAAKRKLQSMIVNKIIPSLLEVHRSKGHSGI